jgi:hypothetical protein
MMARMQKTNRIIGIVAVIVLLIVGVFLALYFGPAARESRGNDQAEAVLMEFGATLKNVSLLADAAALAQAIDQNYAPYITPELLADWKANPTHVPGRLTSSPWPERLTIGTITEQGSGRIVTGEVILVTNGDTAGATADTVPYVAQLIPTDGGWKIAAYQEEKVQTLKNIPTTDEDIPGAR